MLTAIGLLLLGGLALPPVGGCRQEAAPRGVYTPEGARQLLGAYEFWAPGPAEVAEVLAAVDRAIAADARLKPVRTAQFGLAIVGRAKEGVRFVDIYGELDWAKAGVPSPATLVAGYSPTYLCAVYDLKKQTVVRLTVPLRHPPRGME